MRKKRKKNQRKKNERKTIGPRTRGPDVAGINKTTATTATTSTKNTPPPTKKGKDETSETACTGQEIRWGVITPVRETSELLRMNERPIFLFLLLPSTSAAVDVGYGIYEENETNPT